MGVGVRAACEYPITLTSEIPTSRRDRRRTPQKPGFKSNDPVQNHPGMVTYQNMIAIIERYNGIRCLFDTDDMVRIQKHLLSVKPCDQDHEIPRRKVS